MNYWAERQAKAQEKLTKKKIEDVEAQMAKYYASALKKTLDDFEKVYLKVLNNLEDGKEPTAADLYKLDGYWKAQSQLAAELRKLGEKQAALLAKEFEKEFLSIYNSIALPGVKAFTTIDKSLVQQLINRVWCEDGKAWSQRIWENTALLQKTLNEELVNCLVTGKKTTQLTDKLTYRFNVSYHRANTLVRTEMAHIQTQAAAKRYEDYGLEKYEILGNDDDSCGNHGVDCSKLHGKVFRYSEMRTGVNAPPFHPNCKCCIVPVVE